MEEGSTLGTTDPWQGLFSELRYLVPMLTLPSMSPYLWKSLFHSLKSYFALRQWWVRIPWSLPGCRIIQRCGWEPYYRSWISGAFGPVRLQRAHAGSRGEQCLWISMFASFICTMQLSLHRPLETAGLRRAGSWILSKTVLLSQPLKSVGLCKISVYYD